MYSVLKDVHERSPARHDIRHHCASECCSGSMLGILDLCVNLVSSVNDTELSMALGIYVDTHAGR